MYCLCCFILGVFFFQAEDGIRDLVRSRGLGDVYKRQGYASSMQLSALEIKLLVGLMRARHGALVLINTWRCLLYTSDAADERSSVDLGGRRIIKKNNDKEYVGEGMIVQKSRVIYRDTLRQ